MRVAAALAEMEGSSEEESASEPADPGTSTEEKFPLVADSDLDYEQIIAQQVVDVLDDDTVWKLCMDLAGQGVLSPPQLAILGLNPSVTSSGLETEQETASVLAPNVGNEPAPEGASDTNAASTLIMRNLPHRFDQQSARDWVDQAGYANLYDFFLWFPAKATSRLNGYGYAFINFKAPCDAQRFKDEMHNFRFAASGQGPEADISPLSVAIAKVQGFVGNYVRFRHLLEGSSITRCAPFFARGSLDALTPEALEAAERASAASQSLDHDNAAPEGPHTTLAIRNLPPRLETQAQAMDWLDAAGYQEQYSFFLYLPAKRARGKGVPSAGATASQGLGYAFVNFQDPEVAQACMSALDGSAPQDGDPALSVVAARVQGLEDCKTHFSTLAQSGRCKPWVDGAAVSDLQWQ